MSEENKPQRFSINTPAELIRTLEVVRLLIDGTEEEVAKVLGDGQSFQDALNNAQLACPKVDWVRQARVSWLSRGMYAWEQELTRLQEVGISLACHRSPHYFAPHYFDSSPSGLMDHQTFVAFITVGYLGVDCNSVMDRYLELLRRVSIMTGNVFWRSEMAHLIKRRTGCWRDDDPHRDEVACRALFREYGMEGLVASS
ncbi:MAG: hypothetical protein WC750_00635 [Patescibacteria group bacterium]|jgi:hypothetical protein